MNMKSRRLSATHASYSGRWQQWPKNENTVFKENKKYQIDFRKVD
jgi:hypothetical protein